MYVFHNMYVHMYIYSKVCTYYHRVLIWHLCIWILILCMLFQDILPYVCMLLHTVHTVKCPEKYIQMCQVLNMCIEGVLVDCSLVY